MASGGEDTLVFAPIFNEHGLIPAIVTDARSGAVLMMAHMNREALRRTIETGEAHFWSRSRKELWRKGATSGDVQKVVEFLIDCDQDTVLLKVEPKGTGNACHTGRKSCFYRRLAGNGNLEFV
jgi:phosphoribosyl-AMP cyclohydrolase